MKKLTIAAAIALALATSAVQADVQADINSGLSIEQVIANAIADGTDVDEAVKQAIAAIKEANDGAITVQDVTDVVETAMQQDPSASQAIEAAATEAAPLFAQAISNTVSQSNTQVAQTTQGSDNSADETVDTILAQQGETGLGDTASGQPTASTPPPPPPAPPASGGAGGGGGGGTASNN